MQQNVDSNLKPDELVAIAQFLRTTQRSQLSLVMLPGRFSRPEEYAASYWIADAPAAAPILSRYFSAATGSSVVAQATPAIADLKVALINDTKQPELGTQALTLLKQHGFTNSYLSSPDLTFASLPLAKTQVIAQHGNPEAANRVISALGLGQSAVESTGELKADLTVRLGTDWLAALKHKHF